MNTYELSSSNEIISNSDQPKTDSEIESYILDQFKGGKRRLKVYNDQTDYKFNEKGNFNLWFFGNNSSEATALAINHWNNHMFSVRFERSDGPVIIDKIHSSNRDNYVTILPQDSYSVGIEYEPYNDPRKYAFFFGFIDWLDVPVFKKQWKDNENWHVMLTTMSLNNDHCSLIKSDMLINNETGKIKFEKVYCSYISSSGYYYEESTDLVGTCICGMN